MTCSRVLVTATLFALATLGCARRQAARATDPNYLCTAAGGHTSLAVVRATTPTPIAAESAYLAFDIRDGLDSAARVDGGGALLWTADSSVVATGWITPTAAPLAAPAGSYTLFLRRIEFEPYRMAITLRAGFVDTLRGSWRRVGACGWFDPIRR